MKNLSAAIAAMTMFAFAAQPSFANHGRGVSQTASAPALGELTALCCGHTTSSAQIINSSGSGEGVQLQVLPVQECSTTLASTSIENLNGIRLRRIFKFTATGSGVQGGLPHNFGLVISWTDLHGAQHRRTFSTQDGSLLKSGNEYLLITGPSVRILPGATLDKVTFQLDGFISSDSQSVFIQNVYIDNTPVNYDLTSPSAFCPGS